MVMKKSWFSIVKRLFIRDSHSTQDQKKEKRRKWVFGKLKTKRVPSITAPPPPTTTTTTSEETKTLSLSEAEEEQSKHALNVAIASAAAAEAAVAAAHVAAEVVRLTGAPQSVHQGKEKSEESRNGDPQSTYQCQRDIRVPAAIKIQTAFRGYLARKALRALKGIVKLQAIIRGRGVRRQAMSTLKCLQSIVSIQSQVCARRQRQMVGGRWDYFTENEEMQDSKDKIIRMDSNSERKWDDSTLLKEEVDASCTVKKEAALKRERIKEYSFNHRRSAESDRSKVNGRWRYWLEQWVDTQLLKSKELEDLDSVFSSNSRTGDEFGRGRQQLKLKNTHNNRQSPSEGLESPTLGSIRRPFPHRRQSSIGGEEHQSFSSSPATPAYMAATESARAKARSTSSPRVRNLDSDNNGYNSPCKKKLSVSVVSSINSEVLSNGRSSNQQRSPSLKGISVPVKSSRSTINKDLSINSDCSMLNWDRQSSSFK